MPDLSGLLGLLGYDFVLRALAGAVLTGLAAPVVGTYLVQRRQALMGDGIGHIAVTGVALGLITGTSPTLAAVVVAILGAVVIEAIRGSGRANGDVALALLFYGGIAGGVALISLSGGGTSVLQRYLFGSVTTISSSDLVVTAVLAAVVLLLGVGLSPQLFAVTHDEAFARTAGLDVRLVRLLVAVLAAVTVTVAMRTVGLLLVSALMVVPVATAQQFARGFRTTLLGAMAAGVAASLVGVVTATVVPVAPGSTIVLVALAGFVVSAPVGLVLRRRRQALRPFTDPEPPERRRSEGHEHHHGPGCGHPAVEHGDHVDYLHDGHRHAVHGGHYDEH